MPSGCALNSRCIATGYKVSLEIVGHRAGTNTPFQGKSSSEQSTEEKTHGLEGAKGGGPASDLGEDVVGPAESLEIDDGVLLSVSGDRFETMDVLHVSRHDVRCVGECCCSLIDQNSRRSVYSE